MPVGYRCAAIIVCQVAISNSGVAEFRTLDLCCQSAIIGSMNTTFGEAVKKYRIAAGLSLPQLTEASGLNAAYLWRVEAGEREPRVSIARCIADALGVSLDQLCPAGSYNSRAKKSSAKTTPK